MSTLYLLKNMKIKSTKAYNNPRIDLNKWFKEHPEFNKKRIVKIKNILSIVIAFLGILSGYLISLIINL